MSATDTNWPAVTATALLVNEPAPGVVVISTAARALGGVSLGSLKPNSAALKVWVASSSTVTVLSAPAGASLTGLTVRVTAALAESELASLALKLKASGPAGAVAEL